MISHSHVLFDHVGQRVVLVVLLLAAVLSPITESRSTAELIDLVLRTNPAVAEVGDTINVELWFASDDTNAQDWIAADVLVAWDSSLAWVGYENSAGMTSAVSNVFPPIPGDPNAMWWSAAAFSPLDAAPLPGTLVTTLKLLAIASDDHAPITLMSGDAIGETGVFDGNFTPMLGTLGHNSVQIAVPEPPAAFLLVAVVAAVPLRRRGVS